MRPFRLTAACVLSLLCFRSGSLLAQELSGRVFLPDGHTPAAGSAVYLLRLDGATVATDVASTSGEYRLRAPEPGLFSVRVLRIGWLPTSIDTVRLGGAAAVSRDIVLADRLIQLDQFLVQGRSSCDLHGRDADELVQLWDRVRSELFAIQQLSSRRAYDVWTVSIDGHVDDVKYNLPEPTFGPLIRAPNEELDTSSVRQVITDRLFPVAQAETLTTFGYVRRQASGAFAFDAPSAEALVSDAFVNAHCFGIRRGTKENPDWIGIVFTSRQRVDSVVDVNGILWLDGKTGDVHRLEFDYTNLPKGEFSLCDPHPDARMKPPPPDGPLCQSHPDGSRLGLGGVVEFVRVPTGEIFAAHWTIRMPPDAEVQRIAGIRADGRKGDRCLGGPGCKAVWIGWPRLVTVTRHIAKLTREGITLYQDSAALALVRAADRRRPEAVTSRLTGSVTDPTGRAMANVVVQIDQPARATMTDTLGSFVIMLPSGSVTAHVRRRGYSEAAFRIDLTSTRHVNVVLVARQSDAGHSSSPSKLPE